MSRNKNAAMRMMAIDWILVGAWVMVVSGCLLIGWLAPLAYRALREDMRRWAASRPEQPERWNEAQRLCLEETYLAQEAAGRTPELALPPGVTLNDVLFPDFTFKERLAFFLGWERDKDLGQRYRHAHWIGKRILDSCLASRLHAPGRPGALPALTVFVPDGELADEKEYTFCLEPPIGVRVSRFNKEFLEDLNVRLSGLKATMTYRAPGVWLAVPPERIHEKPGACRLADMGAPPPAYRLPLPLGKSTRGPLWVDLAAAPHAIFAGATGSGKSTLIHACLSVLFDRAEVWGLDLKMVELSRYRQRMARLVTEPDAVTGLLAALFQETRRRATGRRSLPIAN